MEDHHFVDAVDELGAEIGLHLVQHRQLDGRIIVTRHLLNHLAAEVGGHHHHGVAEIDGAALAVGEAAVVEYLQEHVEDVGMRLLHLVQKNDAVRLAAYRLGQIAALLVADVTGRRADQAGDRVFLHELAHVDADHVFLAVEKKLGERLAQLGLAYPGRAEEQERTIRPVRVGEARARAADGIAHHPHRLVLADHALMDAILHLQQLVALALHQLADRNAGSARNDLGDFLGANLLAQQLELALFRPGQLGLVQLRLQRRQLAVLNLGNLLQAAGALQRRHFRLEPIDVFLDMGGALHGRLFRLPDFFQIGVFARQLVDLLFQHGEPFPRSLVLFLLHRLALDLELNQPAVELVHALRLGIDLHLDAGSGLVDEIDGLVRQEAVGDVTMRKLGGGDDGRIGDLDAVMQLVLFLQAAQDGDGVLHRRLVHQHLLETTLQRGILLDVLAVFIQRGGADAVQLAARQGRFQHVAGVDGALRLARADHRMNLVDEQDDAALVLRHFLEHGLQALLEFAAILGPGQEAGHVQHQHALALQGLRHLLVDDALRQPLDDGGLAHARLADQHRIVLGAPLQHLDGAANLVVAADHRIELAGPRPLGQIQGVFGKRLALRLGLLRLHRVGAAHRVDGRRQTGWAGAVFAEQATGIALVLQANEQKQLRGNEGITTFLRRPVGQVEKIGQLARGLNLAAGALHLGQAVERGLDRIHQCRHLHPGALQDGAGGTVLLIDQRGKQMKRLDIRIVVPQRQALGLLQGLLKGGSQFLVAHGQNPCRKISLRPRWGKFPAISRDILAGPTRQPPHDHAPEQPRRLGHRRLSPGLEGRAGRARR